MARLTEEGRERGFCVTERHWRKITMALRAPVHVWRSRASHRTGFTGLDRRHGEYQLKDALADIGTRKDRIEFLQAFCRTPEMNFR